MTQKIFTPFQSEIKSFELREAYAGLIEPGVYRGFDKIEALGSDQYKVIHSETGYLKTLINNTSDVNKYGVLFMPNGMVIHDNGEPSFTVTSFTGTSRRVDALLGTIDYLSTAGTPGAQFDYSLVSNVNAQPIPDYEGGGYSYTPPNPAKQIVIGFFITTIDGVTYQRNHVPNLADKDDILLPDFSRFARRPEENTFTGYNWFRNHVYLDSFVQSPVKKAMVVGEDGYLVISGSDQFGDGTEFVFDGTDNQAIGLGGGGGSFGLQLKGFKHANRDFGNNPLEHIVPGATIKIRFKNMPPSNCYFMKSVSGESGFLLREDNVLIKNNILYTIRLEEVLNYGSDGIFSVNPIEPPFEFALDLSEFESKIRASTGYSINIESPFILQADSKSKIYRDYFNNVRIDLLITIPNTFTGTGTILNIPSMFRPVKEIIRPFFYRGSNYDYVTLQTNGNIVYTRSTQFQATINKANLLLHYNINDE